MDLKFLCDIETDEFGEAWNKNYKEYFGLELLNLTKEQLKVSQTKLIHVGNSP